MPAQFGELNGLAASKTVEHVMTASISDRIPDPESVAIGARVASEVIFRTLNSCDVILPEGLSEELEAQFARAKEEDVRAVSEHERRVRAEVIGGELTG